ncbi:UDP-N-acetylmuramate--L-alanine ligase [uncultured Mesonia sp.]|uniref:UDP-N-acetylmuramate--L-alanine ligase n=1 Tax=uncultured Mesonia sp. TaxID=399731 RepID=UPI00374ECD87
MVNFRNIENLYFLGIGGIGMSALARYYAGGKYKVYGYDSTRTQLTQELEHEGAQVVYHEEAGLSLLQGLSKAKTLVVFTPAVAKTNIILSYAQTNQFPILKRAQLLGEITKNHPTLAVAGTHGKTTTTSILAHILKVAEVRLTAFLGGITENYNTNYLNEGNEAIVVEADEFDRSFMHLSPSIAGITSLDADHLDIYKNKESLEVSYRAFISKIEQPENCFKIEGLAIPGQPVGFSATCVYQILQYTVREGKYIFDFKTPNGVLQDLEFALPGRHNLLNAALAMAMALHFGVAPKHMASALRSFKGIKRRFSIHCHKPRVLIEDYAHHPQEIKAMHQAMSEMYPNKRCLAVFQPHLYSRTQDFATEFQESLAAFDEVLLLPIYPAREQAIPGVNSEMLLSGIENVQKKCIQKTDLVSEVLQSDAEVVILLGAGDIGLEAEKIKKALKREN